MDTNTENINLIDRLKAIQESGYEGYSKEDAENIEALIAGYQADDVDPDDNAGDNNNGQVKGDNEQTEGEDKETPEKGKKLLAGEYEDTGAIRAAINALLKECGTPEDYHTAVNADTPEALEELYTNLKARTEGQYNPSDNITDLTGLKIGELELDPIFEEFKTSKTLASETVDKLEAVGIPKQLVTAYMQNALALEKLNAYVSQSKEAKAVEDIYKATTGDKATFDKVRVWANSNLSAEDKQEFETIVQTKNSVLIKGAINRLYRSYKEATGANNGKIIAGNGAKSSANPATLKTFANEDEYERAVNDPRYSKSAEYRNKVAERLLKSIKQGTIK